MNIVIVGTGFSGSIIAREIIDNTIFDVQLIEKRPYIGGNMYDYIDDKGILIQKYGPHFINTNKNWIIKYLSKYSSLIPYDCSLLTYIDGKYMQLPYNFRTLKQLIGDDKAEPILQKLREEFKGKDRVTMYELLNSKYKDVREFANLLYDKAFKTYSSKQRGIPIEQIDKSVINRVKFCIGYDSRYLNKDFQYLPEYGYKKLFDSMLNSPRIHLHLNTDALEHIIFKNNIIYYDDKKIDILIYTGQIDELFKYKFGKLEYRTLIFKYDYYKENKHLPAEIVSYPQTKGFTRSTEYKQFNFHCDNKTDTVVVTEYPANYDSNNAIKNVPCYPVINQFNNDIYKLYEGYSKNYENLFLCGRLAEFKYFNMDAVIESTFDKLKLINKYITKVGK